MHHLFNNVCLFPPHLQELKAARVILVCSIVALRKKVEGYWVLQASQGRQDLLEPPARRVFLSCFYAAIPFICQVPLAYHTPSALELTLPITMLPIQPG